MAMLGAGVALLVAISGCAPSASGANGHRSSTPKPSSPGATPSTAVRLPRPLPTVSATPTAVGFDRSAHSVDDPLSPWVVVNKSRALDPATFTPPELVYPEVTFVNHQPMRPEVAQALVALFDAGRSEAGLEFSVQSAYRSIESQVRVYNDDVARNGQAFADTDTARPAHSEHQTGLAVDISAVPARCSLSACFAQTPQGEWLAANAWRFGFLLRYPADKVEVTGFAFEPWHFRYVGVPLTTQLYTTGVTTLEEFFGLPGGTEYH